MQDAYEHNLRIISERDDELKQYDREFQSLKSLLEKKEKINESLESQLNEVRIQLRNKEIKVHNTHLQWTARENDLNIEVRRDGWAFYCVYLQ